MTVLALDAPRRALIPLLFTSLLAMALAIPALAGDEGDGDSGWLDYGDAPDPLAATAGEYPTLKAHDGARHGASDAGLRLGTGWDAEADGQPTFELDHDDADGNGDGDDGVTFPAGGLVAPATQSVTVTGTAGALLNAWIDYDQNGSWLDAGEQIATDFATDGTAQAVSFTVPAHAAAGITYARFRLDSGGGLSPAGFAADGEVEDYAVRVRTVSIGMIESVSPAQVDAPGGPVTCTVRVTNTGSTRLSLTGLTDVFHGDLTTAPDTTCTLPREMSPGSLHICTFSATVAGDPGDQVTDTVTAVATAAGVVVSATASATVEVVDQTPPEVTAVAAGAGELTACATVRRRIDRLAVRVAEVGSPIEGVGDPASYLLIEAGPDGDFATAACGDAAGDDVAIEIAGLSLLSAGPPAAEVDLALGDSLGAGLYRFFVCDTVTDGAGNALDGDGDGSAGGDFLVPFFRADPFNRFENGHFDDCPVTLEPWVAVATPPNAVEPCPPGVDDSAASPLSSSARLLHASGEPSLLAQCVPVDGGLAYELAARVRFSPVTATVAGFEETCEFFHEAACGGTSLGSARFASVLEDEGGAWISVSSEVVAPAGAASALCDFAVEAAGPDSDFDVYLDGLFLGTGGLFADGFESGDVSAWSEPEPES